MQSSISYQETAEMEERIEIDIPVRGTFHCADPFIEGRPEGGSDVEGPAIVDLRMNGIYADTMLKMKYSGSVCIEAFWDDNPPDYRDASTEEVVGLFSNDSSIESISVRNRVPGAINFGEPHYTRTTFFGGMITDIPEDFLVIKDKEVKVPNGARFLFLCLRDSYYPDNLGSITLQISYWNLDTDGDSLYDSWEKEGIDFDGDGTIDLDLPALGADWEHKDIFVEADYLAGNRPDTEALEDVKDAFANALVSNPDNMKGINLHVLLDESAPWTETISFAEYYALKNTFFGTEEERLNINTIQAKKMVYRYCLFANKLSINGIDPECPGVAEGYVCDDFILAFGAIYDGVGTREDQAAIFMHELGHTLGLHHGGDVDVNFKPNYLSIMNYAFEFDRWVPTRPLDYSYGKCIDIDESNLDEFKGIGQAKATVWEGPNNTILTDPSGMTIDWEYNGWIDNYSVKMNVNNYTSEGFPSPPGETLRDFNDWENLIYKFRGTPLSAASAFFDDYHIELTTDQIAQMEEEAANIIEVDSPTIQDSNAALSTEIVLGVMAVAAIAIVVAVFFFMRRKKI